MSFAQHLITLRKQAGLSQAQLGAEVGVSRQTVSKWELGSTTPELDKLIALAERFDLTLDQLVGRDINVPSHSPQPSQPEAQAYACCRPHYEYKSQRTLFGMPLIHINFQYRGLGRARGIIAIGNVATGIFALGGVSAGLVSLGGVSVGLLSLGGASVGLLTLGGLALGLLAWGGFASGYFAFGGLAVGVYAAGGAALGARVAVGDAAVAPLAFHLPVTGSIAQEILTRFPSTPVWLAKLLSLLSS